MKTGVFSTISAVRVYGSALVQASVSPASIQLWFLLLSKVVLFTGSGKKRGRKKPYEPEKEKKTAKFELLMPKPDPANLNLARSARLAQQRRGWFTGPTAAAQEASKASAPTWVRLRPLMEHLAALAFILGNVFMICEARCCLGPRLNSRSRRQIGQGRR